MRPSKTAGARQLYYLPILTPINKSHDPRAYRALNFASLESIAVPIVNAADATLDMVLNPVHCLSCKT